MESVKPQEGCASCAHLSGLLRGFYDMARRFQTMTASVDSLLRQCEDAEKENERLQSENKKINRDTVRCRNEYFEKLAVIPQLEEENRAFRRKLADMPDSKDAETQAKCDTKDVGIQALVNSDFRELNSPSKILRQKQPADKLVPRKRIFRKKKPNERRLDSLDLVDQSGLECTCSSGKIANCIKCNIRDNLECLYRKDFDHYQYPPYEKLFEFKDGLSRNLTLYLTDGPFKRPLSPEPEPRCRKLVKTSPPFEYPSGNVMQHLFEYSTADITDTLLSSNFDDVSPPKLLGKTVDIEFFPDTSDAIQSMDDEMKFFFQFFQNVKKEPPVSDEEGEDKIMPDLDDTELSDEVENILSEFRIPSAPMSPLSEEDEDNNFYQLPTEDTDLPGRDEEISHILLNWRSEFGADVAPMSPLSDDAYG